MVNGFVFFCGGVMFVFAAAKKIFLCPIWDQFWAQKTQREKKMFVRANRGKKAAAPVKRKWAVAESDSDSVIYSNYACNC